METMPTDINSYLRLHAKEIEESVLTQFPPLYRPGDPVWPELKQLLRKPFPAQLLSLCGAVRRWETARAAAVIVTFSNTWPKAVTFWFNWMRPIYGLESGSAFAAR